MKRITPAELERRLKSFEQLQVVQEKRIADLEQIVARLGVGSGLQDRINDGLQKLCADLQRYVLDLGASHAKLMESHGRMLDMLKEQQLPRPAKRQEHDVSEVA